MASIARTIRRSIERDLKKAQSNNFGGHHAIKHQRDSHGVIKSRKDIRKEQYIIIPNDKKAKRRLRPSVKV